MTDFGINPDAFKENDTRFVAKLSYDDRCAVLALITARVRRDVVARAFGINKRTVTHFMRGDKYKRVKADQLGMGVDAFATKYITEDVTRRVNEAMGSVPAQDPNKRKNQMEGHHTIDNEYLSAPRSIDIRYREDGAIGPGWYFSVDGATWLHNGPESIETSKTCYEAAKENLTDD
jgi:hypothetical protein